MYECLRLILGSMHLGHQTNRLHELDIKLSVLEGKTYNYTWPESHVLPQLLSGVKPPNNNIGKLLISQAVAMGEKVLPSYGASVIEAS